ncbi:ARM repeat superfamily protein [Perilla frutescens var. frutescens]|nr:ARM repeat superfamily protein [Perilla frutescens var. frutescens]
MSTVAAGQPKRRTCKFNFRGLDLDSLLDMSTDELVLERFGEEANGFDQEIAQGDWLLSVGIVSPITKESAGALYHQQLSSGLNITVDIAHGLMQFYPGQSSSLQYITSACIVACVRAYVILSKQVVFYKFQNSKQMVQEGALTALAFVADSSQELFKKYYDAVMPYLKTILVNVTNKSDRMLLTLHERSHASFPCHCLQYVVLLADELKEGFYPYIDQVAPTLVPHLKFYFHEKSEKLLFEASADQKIEESGRRPDANFSD